MNKTIVAAVLGLGLVLSPLTAEAGGRHSSHSSKVEKSKKTERVNGYRRKNGTWVESYKRRPAGEAEHDRSERSKKKVRTDG